jgi:cell division septum initiation protein DivIVA
MQVQGAERHLATLRWWVNDVLGRCAVQHAVPAPGGFDMTLTLPLIGRRSKAKEARATAGELRQRISRAVEQSADVAGRQADVLGKEAGKRAAQIAEQATKLGQEYGHKASVEAERLGRELAVTGAKAAATGAANLRELSGELRSLHVVRRNRLRDSLPGFAVLSGIATGIAAMFFLDPEQGRRRRAMARDKLLKWANDAQRVIGGKTKDMRNRAVGAAHEARSAIASATEALAEDIGLGGQDEELPDVTPEGEQTEELARAGTGL